MRSRSRKLFDNAYEKTETAFRGVQARRDAKKYYKHMGENSPELKEAYEKQVLPFWKKYNIKPPIYWYRLFSKDGKTTDPRYIPDDLWVTEFIPYFSNMFFRRPYEDKCMHHALFPDLNRPRTIVKNIAGEFYTDDLHRLTREEALQLCEKEEKFICKPSIDSGAGRLIQFYESGKDPKEKIEQIFDSFDNCNFIAQEIVKQHPVLASLHQNSLNTVRIVSFFFEGEVHILSAIVRMGTGDARLDNITAGGMQCGVDMTGQLYTLACTKKRDWVDRTPGGTVFADIKVPSFDKIIECVKKEHVKLPHFRLIGWDFSVNEAGEPVFIEYNTCPGPNQMTCGPTFGDLTDKVLEDVFITKSLKAAKN